MPDFIPGQRCISDAEIQMGLGTILSVEERTLTVCFLATGETRTYARQSAPLTRVVFSVGDTITRHDGLKLVVKGIDVQHGLVTYTGVTVDGVTQTMEESELDNFIQLNRPSERLFNGQIDNDKWFRFRYQTLYHKDRLARSDLYGLTGCRTSLIPHQLYIAHEVANRYAPRVLLADEVGLGKTIEAGLILHHQLLTERARRVLIVVPETLLHQWLVEMLRRFNLHFRIFDRARCDALQEDSDFENIFFSEQLVLCSIDFLVSDADVFEQCVMADWDLLIVDEAHHLLWSPDEPSTEYLVVEQLCKRTKGVLLLTATPEQLGKESHFARLRLLDESRFPDFARYVAEEQNYEPYARVIEDLLDGGTLDAEDIALIETTMEEGDNTELLEQLRAGDAGSADQARIRLVEHLLDRHGTGRVLFRNTRAAVKGFPGRKLHVYPLPYPVQYSALDFDDVEQCLSPEIRYRLDDLPEHWTSFDPRLEWLINKCSELNPEKILVITADTDTALELTRYIKANTGLHATAFHEGLSIVERDRAAAFFADSETGSQILVCSEIGSEGRNFQFSHHLVLFDLPFNPDLLEQRIGRLDRIGQTNTIDVHVPYMEASAQDRYFRWYHEALDAFEHTCPAGYQVHKRVLNDLSAMLSAPHDDASIQRLLTRSRDYFVELSDSLHRGRDRLLEYNSCRPDLAADIKRRADESDDEQMIAGYMEQAFDSIGIDNEIHSEGCLVITPTDHITHHLPGLTDEGMTITYHRDVALTFEDAHYISWEHPFTSSIMDIVLSNEMGNTSVTAAEYPAVDAGSVMIECLFSVEAASVAELQSERYLPPATLRVLCDERGIDHDRKLSHRDIVQSQEVDLAVANKIVRAKKKILKAMLKRSEQYAESKADHVLAEAHRTSDEILRREIDRLKALSKVNPNIRADEVSYFENQLSRLDELIDSANIRLEAIRVIVVL